MQPPCVQGKAAPQAASSMPSGCIGHKGCGSAFAHDGIPIRPEIAGPGIRQSRGPVGTPWIGPVIFLSCACFAPFPSFPATNSKLRGMVSEHRPLTSATAT